jgi:hypothetical protein
LYGAKLVVDSYRITASQKRLNDYLKKIYGFGIKTASLLLVANCKIQKNNSNEVIITFPSKELDKLASIITYGTGVIQGCSILKEAFLRDVY